MSLHYLVKNKTSKFAPTNKNVPVFALARMKNSHNNRLYSSVATKKKHVGAKRYLCTRMTFSHSRMMSVGMSKCVYTGLILLDPGVKVNEICYCSLLLSQQLLPVVRQVSGKFRNSAPVYRSPQFSDSNISQSSVAIRLRCGGIFNDSFVANFLQNVPVKEIFKIDVYVVKIRTRVKCPPLFDSRCNLRACVHLFNFVYLL